MNIPNQEYLVIAFNNHIPSYWTGKFDKEGNPVFTLNVKNAQLFPEQKFAQNILDEWDMEKTWKVEEIR